MIKINDLVKLKSSSKAVTLGYCNKDDLLEVNNIIERKGDGSGDEYDVYMVGATDRINVAVYADDIEYVQQCLF